MSFDFAALERRIAKLEASQTASLRFGRVTGVEGGKIRVQFQDGQGMNKLPALNRAEARPEGSGHLHAGYWRALRLPLFRPGQRAGRGP